LIILCLCTRKGLRLQIVFSLYRKHRHSISAWYPGLVQKCSTVRYSVAWIIRNMTLFVSSLENQTHYFYNNISRQVEVWTLRLIFSYKRKPVEKIFVLDINWFITLYWLNLQRVLHGSNCSSTIMLYLLRKKYFADVFYKTISKLWVGSKFTVKKKDFYAFLFSDQSGDIWKVLEIWCYWAQLVRTLHIPMTYPIKFSPGVAFYHATSNHQTYGFF